MTTEIKALIKKWKTTASSPGGAVCDPVDDMRRAALASCATELNRALLNAPKLPLNSDHMKLHQICKHCLKSCKSEKVIITCMAYEQS